MDAAFQQMLANIDSMSQADINSNAQRRFLHAVEVPLATALSLMVPTAPSDRENVYVTWVADSNNIDNRMWQVQNKLDRGQDPRIAVALCKGAIAQDNMWLTSVRKLSLISPYLSDNSFEGVIIVATDDDRATFDIRRVLLLEGGHVSRRVAAALPEIRPEYYSVPLAARRPHPHPANLPQTPTEDLLIAHRNVILEGVAGTGKSFEFAALAASFGQDQTEVAVFHPSSSYEDFVEGLRPATGGGFEPVDGRFLSFCKKAAQDPDNRYLFIIDEINRAAPSRVLGDLLYSVEASKRVNPIVANEILHRKDDASPVPESMQGEHPAVRLQLSRTSEGVTYHQWFCVPDNVYLLGTMNTSDHSVGGIDLALRRRFVFRRLEPLSPQDLLTMLTDRDSRYDRLSRDVKAWSAMNDVLATISRDALMGHSYFFEAVESAGRIQAEDASVVSTMLWRDLILPQLAAGLVAFDAVQLLPALDAAASRETCLTGGYWLESVGTGIDAYPVVIKRSQVEIAMQGAISEFTGVIPDAPDEQALPGPETIIIDTPTGHPDHQE